MNRRSVSTFVAVGLFATLARGEPIQLPYLSPEPGNSQWLVQQQGAVQQQGNQPVFGQAGMLTFNGQQPQRNVNTAEFDEKNKEVTLAYLPVNSWRVTRRVKFEEANVVRIVDLFENTLDKEATVNLTLMSNTNFGVNDSQPVADPKKKDVVLGWAANTGAERAALSLFGGKGAKTVPSVQYQPNNNAVSASMPLKVPGKGKRAIVHWHGTFDNAEAAAAWAGQLREAKDTADLPVDVRRSLANVTPAGAALPDGLELLRGGATDVVELRGGDVLRGDLGPGDYTLATAYGDVTVAPARVAGLIAGDGRQWLVTTDGELFAGQLKRPAVSITLAGGQTPAVPVDRISRIGYRSATADLPEWKFDRPMAFLNGGERCFIDLPAGPFEFVTRYGPLTLRADQIAAVLLPPTAAAHQVYLTDGSRLSGVLASSRLALRPTASPATQPTPFATAAVARAQLRTLPEGVGAGVATLGLLGDDTVAARLDASLRLVTGFDTLTIAGSEIRSITHPTPGQPDVQITTADQSTFRGRLEGATLTVTLTAGPKLTVPVAALRDYDNPAPYPAAGVVAKVSDAVTRLNSDDWKAREAAEAELIATGVSIIGILDTALPTQPPEARDRLTTILRTLRKDQPVSPSRLTPPPAVEP